MLVGVCDAMLSNNYDTRFGSTKNVNVRQHFGVPLEYPPNRVSHCASCSVYHGTQECLDGMCYVCVRVSRYCGRRTTRVLCTKLPVYYLYYVSKSSFSICAKPNTNRGSAVPTLVCERRRADAARRKRRFLSKMSTSTTPAQLDEEAAGVGSSDIVWRTK